MVARIQPQLLSLTPQWCVADKPSGWLVIPGRPDPRKASSEEPVLKDWAEKEIGSELWVTHRIDRETSGVVLFARSADSHRRANHWFSNHEIIKAYDFLAARSPRSPVMRINAEIEGSRSLTQLELKEKFGGGAAYRGRARPVSGRRHQIRIHLQGISTPILGDTRYGGPREIALPRGHSIIFQRTALHAADLTLPSGEVFQAPWPTDFTQWVEALRK